MHYAVNPLLSPDKREGFDMIRECELPHYDPTLFKKQYWMGSALYHVYKNDLHKGLDYVGFIFDDLKFNANTIANIANNPERRIYCKNTKLVSDENMITGHRAIIYPIPEIGKSGLESYNFFFNTRYTREDVFKRPLVMNNKFVVPVDIYEKMMRWLEQFFTEEISLDEEIFWLDGCNTPVQIIEGLTGLFLSLEGIEYENL